jgi:hypothetical protein
MRKIRIDTPEGSVGEPDRWLPFVSRELREPHGFVIVDDGRRNSYAQACNDRGTLVIEYRDGSPLRHFQARGVGLNHVADMLSQWMRGERDFIKSHHWQRLEDWDDPPATVLGQ